MTEALADDLRGLAVHEVTIDLSAGDCFLGNRSVLGESAPMIASSELLSSADGCTVASSVSAPPCHTTETYIETCDGVPEGATDPDAEASVGNFDASTVGWAEPDELGELGLAIFEMPNAVPRAAYKSSAGDYWAYYEDPPGKMVVLDRPRVDYKFGGGCAHNPAYMSIYRWWLTETGWDRRAYDWLHDKSCGQVYSSDAVHFRNGTFCSGRDTHIRFERTLLMGHNDGTLEGTDHGRKDGGCVNLLRHQTKLVRDKPYYSCKGDDC